MTYPVKAVLFDWAGTLTPWAAADVPGFWRKAAAVIAPESPASVADALFAAEQTLAARCRERHRSATLAELFEVAGVDYGEHAVAAYLDAWAPHTALDPLVPPLFAALRERGIRIGVLSNTIWPRAHHDAIFERDGVLSLLDGAVYSSEIPWAKPHPEAFHAALRAVGGVDPTSAVYVGDRLFEDIHGAQAVGMRAVYLPHSVLAAEEIMPTGACPDAEVQRLDELPALVDKWNQGASVSPG